MSAITNTYTGYDAKGIREDLSDAIYDISPKDTPFMSNIQRGSASQTHFEWQVDALASAVTTNAQIDGDDISSFTAVTPTTRLGNYTQIARKDVIISGTLEAVDKAGRKSEKAYQMAKKSAEIKRDMESALLCNQGASAGTTSAARKSGSLLAFLKTNIVKDAGGVNPIYTTLPSDVRTDSGSVATITEVMVKSAISQCWTSGATPEFLMVGAFSKAAISAFSGVATKTFYQSAVEATAIIGAADVYVSDFGTYAVVANRFQRGRDAFLVDPSYAAVMYLRPFTTVDLAVTGDAAKTMLLVEYGLKVHNEAAHAGIFDLATS